MYQLFWHIIRHQYFYTKVLWLWFSFLVLQCRCSWNTTSVRVCQWFLETQNTCHSLHTRNIYYTQLFICGTCEEVMTLCIILNSGLLIKESFISLCMYSSCFINLTRFAKVVLHIIINIWHTASQCFYVCFGCFTWSVLTGSWGPHLIWMLSISWVCSDLQPNDQNGVSDLV